MANRNQTRTKEATMKRTNTTPKTPQQTAEQAYLARRNDIARLIDVLQMELEVHDERAESRPGDWGFACNLAEIRSRLVDLVAFTNPVIERQDVLEFLADANAAD
jgi:hypothetical protein